MKKNRYTLLITQCVVSAICLPFAVAQAGELTARSVEGAQVTTLTTTVTKGSLNIANGRNCLTENVRGVPVLASCQNTTNASPETSTVIFIEVTAGKCLTDAGNEEPSLATCDHQDKKQQWMALPVGGTDVRNVASNTCLTAAGLDKPVKMASCSGLPGQSWTLPR
ncbi:ricin-type beta-trefoil lectin domain protein [Acerihabitans sp. TG2]|uniref:ricin-type beta-trefoil lectin domain protein n=1 Tax=Acerihabitans sp. TG2 TaxID=3096008 RepID=UPI002B23BB31|nr:ricin-type beta-trefoil lectin domain protein [Acerihabitans sp. TG2]MEA9390740.1 ricin-type beta-trefoil lectin domain protein [Acerihabitans sp. TG2]